ncbi:hypothetical protein Dimus_005185 [Dionaea muscipula]
MKPSSSTAAAAAMATAACRRCRTNYRSPVHHRNHITPPKPRHTTEAQSQASTTTPSSAAADHLASWVIGLCSLPTRYGARLLSTATVRQHQPNIVVAGGVLSKSDGEWVIGDDGTITAMATRGLVRCVCEE